MTKTNTATDNITFSVTTKELHFDNADCTGALVATGAYSQPDETLTYPATPASASVQSLTGVTDVFNIDPVASVLAGSPSSPLTLTFTGNGVVTSTFALGSTLARIRYADVGEVVITRPGLTGLPSQGAFLLQNDEMLALVPIGGSTTSFKVLHRYTR